jgi:hypothetical protein
MSPYTLSQREREGPALKAWEGEGVKRPTACRQGALRKTVRV